MDRIHSYPKVYNMGHAAIAALFDDPVVVQEKVDGSQFSFGVLDGELRCRSKGAELVLDAPEKMFARAVETALQLAPDLKPGWVYRAEYLQGPSHNTLRYERVPARHLILFDVCTGLEVYAHPVDLEREAERLGLETVPLLAHDHVRSVDELTTFLERESVLGGTKVEGVVCKNYARWGRDGKALMGKLVAPAFREVHEKSWKVKNPTGRDIVGQLGQRLRSEARWRKALQHLDEAGALEHSPKDIGSLIKAVPSDVLAEHEEEIKAALFKWAWPKIRRQITAGLLEWYKEQLLARQFGD